MIARATIDRTARLPAAPSAPSLSRGARSLRHEARPLSLEAPSLRHEAPSLRHEAPSLRLATRRRASLGLALWGATTALLLAGLWWVAAPPQLGGRTSFVEVDGTSMLPRLHYGDLALLRASGSYRVGQVVGYRSALLDRVVLHRIVALDHGRYTFKGDNNGFLDPEHPTRASLVGREWVVVPSAGKVVSTLHVPWVVGALATLLVLVLGLGGGATVTADEPATRRAR